MTTKEQERQALAKIRKIVEGLGEGSYVGTAFEGCFDIAESNIEYDFAESMMNRFQTESKKADDLAELLKTARRDLANAGDVIAKLTRTAEANEKSADTLRYELEKTRGALADLKAWTDTAKAAYTRRLQQVTDIMVSAAEMEEAYADTPKDIAYRSGLENLRKAKAERAEIREALAKLEGLKA